MPTVTETLVRPDLTPITQARVEIRLFINGTDGVAYLASSEIFPKVTLHPDSNGLISVTLPANSTLTPSGSYYQIDISIPGELRRTETFIVPAGAGPYLLGSILSVTPTAGIPFLSDTLPLALAAAALAGTDTKTSRDDHVHPTTGLAVLTSANLFTQAQTGPFLDKGGQVFHVDAYGAVADTGSGTTDSTAAIQAAIDAVAANKGGILAFGPRTYVVSSSLMFVSLTGVTVQGAGDAARGNWGTQLQWKGNTTSPMFRVQDCNRMRWADFAIRPFTAASYPLSAGVWIENLTAGVSVVSQHNIWDNITIDGAASDGSGLHRGWVMQHFAGDTDSNNDFMEFRSCQVQNYGVAGWLINSSQSKGHMFWNCSALPNNTLARVAVGCQYDWDYLTNTVIAVASGGSFSWHGGQISRGAEAAFVTSAFGDVCWIGGGANIENSVRLLVDGVAVHTATNPTVVINGVRYAPNLSLNADGFFLVQNGRNSLDITGLRVETGGTGYSPQIKQAGPTSGSTNAYANCTIRNSHIDSESLVLFGSQTTPSRGVIENVTWRNRTANTYGNYANGVYAGTAGGPIERWGTGSPEGVLVAPIGSVFHRTDGGAATSLYIKEANATSSGWVGK